MTIRTALAILTGLLVTWEIEFAVRLFFAQTKIGTGIAAYGVATVILLLTLRAVWMGSRPARIWLTVWSMIQIATLGYFIVRGSAALYPLVIGVAAIAIRCAVIAIVNLPPLSQMVEP